MLKLVCSSTLALYQCCQLHVVYSLLISYCQLEWSCSIWEEGTRHSFQASSSTDATSWQQCKLALFVFDFPIYIVHCVHVGGLTHRRLC